MVKVTPFRPAVDPTLAASVASLVGIGLVMVLSASSATAVAIHHDAFYFLKRQLAWLAIALVLSFFAYRIDYRKLRRFAPLGLYGSAALLLAVLVPHLGIVSGGARRWLGFGPLTFEPSEFAKLGIVLYLASALAAKGERIRSLTTGVIPLAAMTAVVGVLVLREPDLGTASLLMLTAGTMLFAAGARVEHLFAVAVTMLLPVVFVVRRDPYKLARITAFLDPWKDQQDKGFHIVQSLMALGSGGWTGVGIGFSRQKFFWLPEPHTDFIGAIIGEELGFVGLAAIVALFLIFGFRAVGVALNAPDRFGYFLTVGCLATIVVQAFVNLGVVTSSWPVTGVPLPFISFGGSSLVVSLVAVALIANVDSRRAPPQLRA